MPTLFDLEARADIERRVRAFGPDARRRWGRMSAPETLAHLADQLRMGLGEIAPGRIAGPFTLWPLNRLIIHWLPWPRGRAQGPPAAFTTPPGEWEADRSALLRLIARFGGQDPAGPWPPNPVFGRLTGRDWGVLSYRHLDHHLRQWGC